MYIVHLPIIEVENYVSDPDFKEPKYEIDVEENKVDEDNNPQIIQVETNAVPYVSQPSLPNNHALR